MRNLIDTHIGRRLQQRRTALQLDEGSLARLLDVEPERIGQMERGDLRISAAQLLHLASALDVPIRYFFEGQMQFGTDDALNRALSDTDAVGCGFADE